MQWLVNLIEKLFSFIPRLWFVEPDEGGIRITLGKHIDVCDPGWYIYWPLIQGVRKTVVVCQLADLKNQSIRTKDNCNIIMSGGVQYIVVDVSKVLLKVHDYDKGIQIKALDTIAEYTKNRTLAECQDFEALKEQIHKGLAPSVKEWGIEIEDILITDLVEGKSIRLLSDMPTMSMLPMEGVA
jgi:regulator of protease activity HflC (stomatin/prohibitin superfamily)